MRTLSSEVRLLGVVQLRIGPKLFALPVHGLTFAQDGEKMAGGFFASGDELGILVDERSPCPVADQIRAACSDAVKHLSSRIAN
jgi:hypothetical protein